MLEFLFGSKSPVQLRLYLKFNLFKYPVLRLTRERWSRERTDQDNMFFFFFPFGLTKKKNYLTNVRRRPHTLQKEIMVVCPTRQRRA